jgi:hypothetical protein
MNLLRKILIILLGILIKKIRKYSAIKKGCKKIISHFPCVKKWIVNVSHNNLLLASGYISTDEMLTTDAQIILLKLK